MKTLSEEFFSITNRPKTDKHEWLYLVFNNYTKLVKIGITTNYDRRMREIANNNGIEIQNLISIQLEAECDEPAAYIEKFLHDKFKHKRKKGEWFNLSAKEYLSIRNLIHAIDGIDIYEAVTIENYLN